MLASSCPNCGMAFGYFHTEQNHNNDQCAYAAIRCRERDLLVAELEAKGRNDES